MSRPAAPSPPHYSAFAIAAPGLSPLVADELRALPDVRDIAAEAAGVAFSCGPEGLYAANLHSRVASRVVVRIAAFHARSFAELERHAKRMPLETFVGPGQLVRLSVTCRKSRLYHSGAVAQRLGEAIVKRTGAAIDASRADPEPEEESAAGAAAAVLARVANDRVTVSVDASGDLLHLRGYRQALARAPLRETLAAAMLRGAGWTGDAGAGPLVDPLCGSGTIPIEAALLARRIAPGIARGFAFERWPAFDASRWDVVRARAREAERPLPEGIIIRGSDRDAGAIAAAVANAERAGVAGDITFERRALSAIEPPPSARGLLIANPPYGVRVGERAPLRDLYAALGNVARTRCPGWTLALLSADRLLERQVRVPFTLAFQTNNGGIPVRLLLGTVTDLA